MSCYHPLKAYRTPNGVVFQQMSRHDIVGDIELPCGQCIGCRMRKASDWAVRVMHEAHMWDSNCFVTLTYARDCLPPDGSLDHRDYQLFMKKLRHHAGAVRFYMCGEYGETTFRPHYHACLFGVDFRDRIAAGKSGSGMMFFESKTLSKLWDHGFATVQDLTKETAGYCARYIMKKQTGEDAKYTHYCSADGVLLKEPYAAMSLKPGIGAKWFEKFGRDIFPHDIAIMDGVKHQVPKFYDKLLKRDEREFDPDGVEYDRYLNAKKSAGDNTDQRRQVKEIVHTAKVRNFNRSNV